MPNIEEYHAIEHSPSGRRLEGRQIVLQGGIALLTALVMSACASTQYAGTYKQQVLGRPLPASEADARVECAWIRDEMGRQQDVATRRAVFAEGREAVLNRVNLEQNLIVLETRAKAAHCNE